MKQAIAEALSQHGYETLTPVQEAVTREGLEDRDLLVSAQTGSGKTVGFGLAIAPTLLGPEERFGPAADPLALVIAPTRELALQVRRELGWLYGPAGAVVTSCVGGMDMREERRALAKGAHVVVATPGRLRDHIMRGSLVMDALRAVVLDEADEMLDLGFREDLEFILDAAPANRRTLMFSATVPKTIATLARSYQRDAERIVTASGGSQHADIAYQALAVQARDAENAIINVLRYHEAPNALVFCNTRAMVNRLLTRFSNRGFSVVALSGELTQTERTHALQAMRDGRARVCIATDVAARGIDLPNLDLVIHADLPSNSETLLHRSGRTGRAGRKGVSVLIVPDKLRRKAEMLLKGAKVTPEWTEAPSAEAVVERDRERMLADPAWNEPLTESEAEAAAMLTGRFSPTQLAAAYLRLLSTRVSAPEDLSPAGATAPAAPRERFGPSVWLSVAGGRAAGAEPRRLLPVLCKAGNLSRDDVGAIRVQADESYVEILAASLEGFLDALGSGMALEGAAVKVLDSPPAAVQRGARPGPQAERRPPERVQGKRRYGADAETRPEARPETRPETRPDAKADVRSDGKPDTGADARRDATEWKRPARTERPAAPQDASPAHPSEPAAPTPEVVSRKPGKLAAEKDTAHTDSAREDGGQRPRPSKAAPVASATASSSPPVSSDDQPAATGEGLTAKRYKPRHTTAQKAAARKLQASGPDDRSGVGDRSGTPVGKANSKKNRARAIAAKGKPGGGRSGARGGAAPPKRRPTGDR